MKIHKRTPSMLCGGILTLLFTMLILPTYALQPAQPNVLTLTYLVANQYNVSDLGLNNNSGDDEDLRIRDKLGYGASYSRRLGEYLFFDIDYSAVKYDGELHSGLKFGFEPQTGHTDFTVLSTSSNVTYRFDDLNFTYTKVGLSLMYTDNLGSYWQFGAGRTFQGTQGSIKIIGGTNTQIAELAFDPSTPTYHFHFTYFYNFRNLDFADNLHIFFRFQYVEALAVKVNSCNTTAIGTAACINIGRAQDNRSQRLNLLGGILLGIGSSF